MPFFEAKSSKRGKKTKYLFILENTKYVCLHSLLYVEHLPILHRRYMKMRPHCQYHQAIFPVSVINAC